MMDHPLSAIMKQYLEDFGAYKKDNEELDNLSFNRQFGLQIDPPIEWPIVESMQDAAHFAVEKLGRRNFVVVYSTTAVYNKVSKVMDDIQGWPYNIFYCSWHELYSAAARASEDVTYIRHLKNQLMNADVVFFVGASAAVKDVSDLVKASTTGCLITIA